MQHQTSRGEEINSHDWRPRPLNPLIMCVCVCVFLVSMCTDDILHSPCCQSVPIFLVPLGRFLKSSVCSLWGTPPGAEPACATCITVINFHYRYPRHHQITEKGGWIEHTHLFLICLSSPVLLKSPSKLNITIYSSSTFENIFGCFLCCLAKQRRLKQFSVLSKQIVSGSSSSLAPWYQHGRHWSACVPLRQFNLLFNSRNAVNVLLLANKARW